MEGSDDSKMEKSLKDGIDGSGKVAVEEVDFGDPIEFRPEPEPEHDWPEAVEVVQEGLEVEISGSSTVTTEEKEVESSKEEKEVESSEEEKEVESSNLVSEYEQKVEEAVNTTDIPVSDTTNVEASSGVAGSVEEKLDVGSSVPAGDATVAAGIPQVSEIPRSTEDQPPPTVAHETRSFWTSCCGLFDALRGAN